MFLQCHKCGLVFQHYDNEKINIRLNNDYKMNIKISNGQKKFKFDEITIKKIIRGGIIAGTGSIALYLLRWMSVLNFGTFTPIVAGSVPFFVNAVREWVRGNL